MEKTISINKKIEAPVKVIDQQFYCGDEINYCSCCKNGKCEKFNELLHFSGDFERCQACLQA